MNQSALEGFVKIVEMDSFSAAAEALYLSQSALSQQIRTLEGQLQFELFQHVPRRVILTPAGRDFYPKAKQLTALYQEAVRHARAVQQQENPPERHLVIAWSHEAMRMFGYDLFSLTNELCLQYTSIMMQCASRSEVWRSLKKGDADLSFQLESAEFYAQGFTFSRWAASAAHPMGILRSRWFLQSITADRISALRGCWTGAGDTGLASCWGKSAGTRG